MFILPASLAVQTVEDFGEQNADVILYRDAYYRAMRAFVDPIETALNSVTGARLQPRNIPDNLPAIP